MTRRYTPPPPAVQQKASLRDFVLVPNGVELFLPVLAPNTCHLVCIEGTYEYRSWLAWYAADARYTCDDSRGVFSSSYPWYWGLRLCGKRVEPLTEDRKAHRYTYALPVEEQPLKASVILIAPAGPEGMARGTLRVSIRQTAAEETGRFGRLERIGESGAAIAQRKAWVEQQIRRYEHSPHFTDETFLRDLAASSGATLLAKREEIHDAWERFHSDPQATELLRKLSPVTYERAQAMPRALAIAEQIAVRPKKLTGPVPEPKRKETHEEWRERQLRHRRNQAMVSLAFARERQDQIAELDTLGLDPDEYNRRLAALDEIYADPDPRERAYNEKL